MNAISIRRAIGALGAMLSILAWSGPALAHAVLLTTAPAENTVVQDAPEDFILNFNEPVSVLAASLITPEGEQIDVGAGATNGASLTIPLPEGLGEGTHVLSWRVVSVDGHPIGGATAFSVRVVTGGRIEAATTDPIVSTLLWASKLAVFSALFLGAGMAVFAGVIIRLPQAAERIASGLIGVGLVATPLSLGLQGADALAHDIGGLLFAQTWATGAATSYGWTALMIFASLLLAALALRAKGRQGAIVAGAAWLIGALSLALSGHASAADPQWITRPAVFLHIGGILFWTGALIPLLILLKARAPEATLALARFSAFIPYAVATILFSGLTLALIQMGRDTDQWLSPYGVILAAKLGLLSVLFGLAIWNRFKLTRPALAGRERAQRMLKLSVVAEIILIVVILGLVAGWRFTPPPRALADMASVPVSLHIHTDALMADVSITPGRTGPNTIAIFLMDGEFSPVEPVSVEIAVSAPDLGVESIRLPARLDDDGFWRVETITLPLRADWQLDVDIRLTRFEMTRLTQTFTLP